MRPLLVVLVLVVVLVVLMPRTALGYVKGEPVELELSPIGGGHYLRTDAAQAFNAMKAAAAEDGVELIINESFRSMPEQEHFYELYLAGGSLAAKPGWSNHQGGIAVDLDLVDDAGKPRPAAAWLNEHAWAFNFTRTVSSEPWHWEYRP